MSGLFNVELIDAINNRILPGSLDIARLEATVADLIADSLPPTHALICDKLRSGGTAIELSESVRIALSVLPSTGKFLRSSADSLFPADMAV